jgi:uncharacterized membrane protein YccC
MRPELASAIRTILIAVGAFAVGRGWLADTDMGVLADGLVSLAIAAVGVWGVYAKRPTSIEAQMIAGGVKKHPDAKPIT